MGKYIWAQEMYLVSRCLVKSGFEYDLSEKFT